jgi:hypothetical protein
MGGYGGNWNQPNFTQILYQWWGGAYESSAWANYAAAAANVLVGTNPPWTLSDFLATNAKFFGPATAATVNTLLNSTGATITLANQFATPPPAGTFVTGQGIPPGTTLVSVGGFGDGYWPSGGYGGGVGTDGTVGVTLSNPATLTQMATPSSLYYAPWLPILVIQLYINLATSCLQQLRWGQMWYLAMGFYVAHFCTLFIQSDQGANLTAAEVATSGLQQGIITSQSAGDVSASTQPVTGLDDWAGWNLTAYGIQLVTFAKVMGAGIMYLQ